MNALSLAWSFFVTPDAALRQLRAKPTFLFPLLLVTLGSAALLLWQYALVDIDWLKDYLMSGNARFKALPDAERARALAVMTRTTLSVAGVAALVIGTPAICLLQALYYFVAGRVTHVAVSYRQWFALVCWTLIPTLVSMVYGAILLATTAHGAQLSPGALQPLSLNELVFHHTPADPGYSLLAALGLLNLWIWGLSILGVRQWSARSWLFSAVFVLLPAVVVYGLWALLAFRNAG